MSEPIRAALAHVISPEEAVTLDGLFRERVKRTPDAVAYRDLTCSTRTGAITPGRRSITRSRAGRRRSSATACNPATASL